MVRSDLYYNIDPFYNNKLLDFKVFALSVIKKIFTVKFSASGVSNFLNKDLGQILTMTEGILKVIPVLDIEDIETPYLSSEKALTHFIKIYNSIEKRHFFNNEVTRETCEAILKNLYKAESKLRHLKFDAVTNNEDKDLNDAATLISIRSI
jgi:hypothetical protein